ncbi:ATP synthase subunit K [Spirochaeta africana]|uniref:ATP synthase subunit C n=1 Tax=Spirochaeta africana (strain ATCC 700263 / DSM 8902 / Z-7692) TaxID=889378 RepID=H9UJK6_SPIAZ|nr:ATP synthase subunit K [Spirochaeta africana]AFG37699.1 ATP synthase subunit C [Spirochaeta africana DSM 8902]
MDIGLIGVASALAFAAVGSAIGAGTAGMAAVGAWKKCFMQNKPAPFLLIAFVGAPLTQTIYGFILMNALADAAANGAEAMLLLGAGVLGGIAMGFSAAFQGKAAAVSSDALAESGKGFGNFIIVLGLVETVALFVMVFLLTIL